ncbi:hypothetical protein [Frisingicoccus sp.]|uniref:hypothetical protein n=1 Tax=Frisingicoccus sp. TaxID=1918627 RepID=UPI003AB31D76
MRREKRDRRCTLSGIPYVKCCAWARSVRLRATRYILSGIPYVKCYAWARFVRLRAIGYLLKLPRLKGLVWLRGRMDGRNGTAALNDRQVVQSGEVQMYQKRFQMFVGARIRNLDEEFHSLSAESEKLIYELNKKMPPIPECRPVPEGANAMKQRAAERKAYEIRRMKEERRTQREADIKRLIDIRTAFSEKEASCLENLMRTAAAIEEILAVYCKGVFDENPLFEKNIPAVNVEGAIKQFYDEIEWPYAALERIDKEVQKYHENL